MNKLASIGILLLGATAAGACPSLEPERPIPDPTVAALVHVLAVLLLAGCAQSLRGKLARATDLRTRARAWLGADAILLASVAMTFSILLLEGMFGPGPGILGELARDLDGGIAALLAEALRIATVLGLLLASGLYGPARLARCFFDLDAPHPARSPGGPFFEVRRLKDAS